MRLLSILIKNIIKVGLGAFVKQFRWAGVLFLVLIVECVCVGFYCKEQIEYVDISDEPVKITNISWEPAVNQEGEEGYLFYLTLQNDGSMSVNVSYDNLARDDKGYSLLSEDGGAYVELDDEWGRIYTGYIIPPGTQTVATTFITQTTLEFANTENIVFRAGLDGVEEKISLGLLEQN